MDIKLKPLQKRFTDWLEDPARIERIAVTIWKNGRGQTAFVEDSTFRHKVLRLLKDLREVEKRC